MPTTADNPTVAPTAFTPTVTAYSQTAHGLIQLQQRFANVVFDVKTVDGMKEAKSGRKELRSLRSDLEKTRVQVKAPVLDQCRLIDEEAKFIDGELEKLLTPIDKTIKAEEARLEAERIEKERAEKERIDAIQARITDIRNLPLSALGKSAAEIAQMAKQVDNMPIDAVFFGGYANEASIARNAAAAKLRQAHAAQLAAEQAQAEREAERAKLERLRAEQAARDAQVRAAREAQERAERETREAAFAAEQQKLAEDRAAFERIRAEQAEKESALKAQAEKLARQEAAIVAATTPKIDLIPAEVEDTSNPRLDQAHDELRRFRDAFGDLPELESIVAAIDGYFAQ